MQRQLRTLYVTSTYSRSAAEHYFAFKANLQTTVFLINYIRVYQPADAVVDVGLNQLTTTSGQNYGGDFRNGSNEITNGTSNETIVQKPNAANKVGALDVKTTLGLIGLLVPIVLMM